jgi:DNA uptake protein ComE-like DNA-binding protein
MKINIEPIRKWFGYSRRERRSSSILLIILVIVILVRYVVPGSRIAVEDVSSAYVSGDEVTGAVTSPGHAAFSFNPNTASFDTLIMLGLTQKEASTLISYRKKGGKFRRPADLKKVYGLDSIKAERLVAHVETEADTIRKKAIVHTYGHKPPVDLNNCDSATLVSLPGIGPVLAARIIKYRHLLGGFARVEQLKEVYGIKPETYDLLVSRVTADSSVVERVNVNTAGYREFSRLRYFEKYDITAVLKYRELHGKIIDIAELVDNKIITAEKAAKVLPYLKFNY